MRENYPKEVENYTDAFWTTAGGILIVAFWVIAGLTGFLWVAVLATLMNRGITYVAASRS